MKDQEHINTSQVHPFKETDVLPGYEDASRFLLEYRKLMMLFESAIQCLCVRLDMLEKESRLRGERSPIRTYTHRLKDPRSIHEKLARRGYPITWKSILENLNDVAGVRIICEYLQDIETVRDGLLADDFLELLREKDYIRYPKPNGYRSLHLIVNVPVPMSDGPRKIRCEIQLRTTAMDCWAGLEHNLRYKKNRAYDANIDRDLKDCADMLFETDQRLQDIALRMEVLERQNAAYSNHQRPRKEEPPDGQKSS